MFMPQHATPECTEKYQRSKALHDSLPHRLSLLTWMLAALIVLLPSTTTALTTEDILRPYRDRIDLCEQAKPEILRQAQLHQHHLETLSARVDHSPSTSVSQANRHDSGIKS